MQLLPIVPVLSGFSSFLLRRLNSRLINHSWIYSRMVSLLETFDLCLKYYLFSKPRSNVFPLHWECQIYKSKRKNKWALGSMNVFITFHVPLNCPNNHQTILVKLFSLFFIKNVDISMFSASSCLTNANFADLVVGARFQQDLNIRLII